jgi:lipoprotein signal peptidase
VRLQYATNSHSVLDRFGPSAIIVYSAVMSLALLGVLVHRVLRKRPSGFLLPAGFVTLLAGTLGNLHDRLERGYVIDFISLPGVNWPQTFNVADVSIALGIVLCLLGLVAAALRHARAS